MSVIEPATQNAIHRIGDGFATCLSLWGDIKVTSQSLSSMNTREFRDMAVTFEAALQLEDPLGIRKLGVRPENIEAFNQGDVISRDALRVVAENQMTLILNLEDIKRQFNEQFNPRRRKPVPVPPPGPVLDIDTIMSLRETVLDHANSASRTLKELAKRIEAMKAGRHQMGSSPSFQPSASFQSPSPVQSSPSPQPSQQFKSSSANNSFGPELPARPKRSPQPVISSNSASPTREERLHGPEAINKPNNTAVPLTWVSTQPGRYCTGALRLQRNKQLSIRDIVYENKGLISRTDTRLLCKHCNLEIGDAHLWNTMLSGEQERTEIAQQHILACASLTDRKAMFRCLLCCQDDLDAEFRSADDFRQHLKSH